MQAQKSQSMAEVLRRAYHSVYPPYAVFVGKNGLEELLLANEIPYKKFPDSELLLVEIDVLKERLPELAGMLELEEKKYESIRRKVISTERGRAYNSGGSIEYSLNRKSDSDNRSSGARSGLLDSPLVNRISIVVDGKEVDELLDLRGAEKITTSIYVDKELWQEFTRLVTLLYGRADRRALVIEKLLKLFVAKAREKVSPAGLGGKQKTGTGET